MIFTISDCTVDTDTYELRRNGQRIAVEPQVFDLLVLLLENRDRLVTKEEIVARVWNGRIVSESALSSRMKALRKAIGDDGASQNLIRTVRRRGFRVIADVTERTSASELPDSIRGALAGGTYEAEEFGSTPMSQATFDPPPAQAASREKPSIAVLPFVNMSGDTEQEYFSDGITEDIITAFSRLRWFLVIARHSTFAYKGKTTDIRQIGRELDVNYVLEGSVRKAGNRVRVSAELVDTRSGVQHWAEKYDHELQDVFLLQDEITQNVTAAIEPKLVAAENIRSQARSSDDLSAWDLVTRALSHYGRMTKADTDKAIAILRQAVRDYPDYGPAHSLLSFALLVSGHVGWIPESDEYKYAADLARRALEIDDEDPWAHMALGYLAFTERQTAESVREYTRAIDLNPNFATAHGYFGWALAFDGQSEKAIAYFQQALRMSPHDPLKAFFYSGTGVAHYYAERYDEAIEWARRAIRERPGFSAAHRILCAALAQAGRDAETEAAMEKLRDVQPNVSIAWIEQHVPYTQRAMPHFLDGMRKAGLT